MRNLPHLRKAIQSREFQWGFSLAFVFHILISLVIGIAIFLLHHNSNACPWCVATIGTWNSISTVMVLFIGSLIPATAPFYVYKIVNIIMYPLFLITPMVFGISGGYARLHELDFPRRFFRAFVILYLPIWIPASIVAILWLGFDILIV